MSRRTRESLNLADEMQAAGVDVFYVTKVRSLINGYRALRATASLLHKDNMELRKHI